MLAENRDQHTAFVVIISVIAMLLIAMGAAVRCQSRKALPQPYGFVSDFAAVMNPVDVTTLTHKLSEYEKSSRNEISVVTIKTLGDMTVDEYANKLFHQWGIGKAKEDNGVLLLVAVQERKIRIEVGYGLESDLPDGRAGIIIRESIAPFLKQGKWYEGINSGVDAIMSQIPKLKVESSGPSNDSDNDHSILIGGGILALGIFGVGCFAYYYESKKKREDEENRLANLRSYKDRHKIYDHVSVNDSYPKPKPNQSSLPPTYVAPRRETRHESSYVPVPVPIVVSTPSPSYDYGSSSASSFGSSSDSGSSFSGGDSGGGGASGDF